MLVTEYTYPGIINRLISEAEAQDLLNIRGESYAAFMEIMEDSGILTRATFGASPRCMLLHSLLNAIAYWQQIHDEAVGLPAWDRSKQGAKRGWPNGFLTLTQAKEFTKLKSKAAFEAFEVKTGLRSYPVTFPASESNRVRLYSLWDLGDALTGVFEPFQTTIF